MGIFGREAASVEDFEYSDAMQELGIVWDEESLDALMADTQGFLPGIAKDFVGVLDADHRADIIAYLREMTEVEQ